MQQSMVKSELGLKQSWKHGSCLVSTFQVGGGDVTVEVGGLTSHISTAARRVHSFMTIMYPASDGCFQQENTTTAESIVNQIS